MARFFSSQPSRLRPDALTGGPEQQRGLVPPPQAGAGPGAGAGPQERPPASGEQPAAQAAPPEGGGQRPRQHPRHGSRRPHRGTAGAAEANGKFVPLATALPGDPRGSAPAASHPQRPQPQLKRPPDPLPPLAAAPAEMFRTAEQRAVAAGPGSGSLSRRPLPPAAGSGSQRGHYSARHAQRRRRHCHCHSPPSAGGDSCPVSGDAAGGCSRPLWSRSPF